MFHCVVQFMYLFMHTCRRIITCRRMGWVCAESTCLAIIRLSRPKYVATKLSFNYVIAKSVCTPSKVPCYFYLSTLRYYKIITVILF